MPKDKSKESKDKGRRPGLDFGYSAALDRMEKDFRLSSGGIDPQAMKESRVSTGLLMYDLVLGGGIIPGWYETYGGEGSGKSTGVMAVVANSLNIDVPIVAFYDYEQALNPEYNARVINSIAEGNEFEHLFGLRNPKTGKWDVQPRIRYYPSDVGEDFYKSAASLLRSLPDKMYMGGKWYYVMDRDKRGQAYASKFGYDKKLLAETGRYYIEATDGGRLQALILLDSIPAMNPESQEEDDPSGGMAEDARMHAKHLKKVRGKLRKKHVAVLVVNQLRLNPGARFGNPEYRPGGKTLEHAADCRVKQAQRASPHGTGRLEEEASVLSEKGTDTYIYVHMKNEKNKYSTPYCEGWFRIWTSDHLGEGHGFDIVYDTFMYLKATGHIDGYSGSKEGKIPKKFTVRFDDLVLKDLGWLDFKALILLRGKELKEQCIDLKLKKFPKIRERCFEELRSGVGFDKYHAIRVGGLTGGGDEDDEDDDIDEDDDD